MKGRPFWRAVAVMAVTSAVLGVLQWRGIGLELLLVLGVVVATTCWALPWIGVRWLDDVVTFVRARYWAGEEGRFHSFGGVPLQVEDDGRHVWVEGEGLMRALGKREPEPALAARHAGRWQRNAQGQLMLRVDAVVQVLLTMPGRSEPRVQRLRRYFERDVLYPAARRRQRTRG